MKEFCTYKFTGQRGGFGFVDMPAQTEAQAAISGLNTKELIGRALNVNDVRLRRDDYQGRDKFGGGGFGGGRRY
jgi:RNA recognition motif-containing protein